MKLWNDECGAIISAELVLVMTIVGIGMIAGLKALQAGVLGELNDVADAIGSVNQSYSVAGASSCYAVTAGSVYADVVDDCDATVVAVDVPATPEG